MTKRKGYHPPPTRQYVTRLDTVKEYIMSYWGEHKFSPGNNEIAAHFNTSTSVAAYWLNSLEKEGWILPREPKISRNIVPQEIARKLSEPAQE